MKTKAAVFSILTIALSLAGITQSFASVRLLNVNGSQTLASETIKSAPDLQRYLAATARTGSPLDFLSQPAKQRFLASLSFNQRGVTAFRYDDLRAELSASQIRQVLALFGLDRDTYLFTGARIQTREDYDIMHPAAITPNQILLDYACVGRGTCHQAPSYACTDNC